MAEVAAKFELEVEDKLVKTAKLVQKHQANERQPLWNNGDRPTPPPLAAIPEWDDNGKWIPPPDGSRLSDLRRNMGVTCSKPL